jgi:hypothetical protein
VRKGLTVWVRLRVSGSFDLRAAPFAQDDSIIFVRAAPSLMAGWELPQPDDTRAKASKAAETHDKGKRGQRHRPR